MRRFVQSLSGYGAWLEAHFPGLSTPLSTSPDRYNISGRGAAFVVLETKAGLQARECIWGIVPPWSKTSTTQYTTVTARVDRAARSRMYRRAWATQRCVVPMNGYYKWDRTVSPARPYFIQAASGEPLLAAGLWECWDRDGPALYSFSVLTYPNPAIPPPLVRDGPVFLPPADWRRWLQRARWLPERYLRGLKQPQLEAYRVGTAVRDAGRDDYTLLEPVQGKDSRAAAAGEEE
ncbi:MAG: SOS response-associated peptidase [Lysobacter sp.]|nr:SOS response-associated peptidase [Lysobacter sp.]